MAFEFKVDRKVILLKVEEKNKAVILQEMADKLEKAGYVKRSFIDNVLKREAVFPTGLQSGDFGVAIPHTDVEHVNSPMISVATLKYPVEFNMMGGEKKDKVDVKVIFMLAMKDGNAQVDLLQKLMKIIQNTKLLNDIYKVNNVDVLLKIINENL